MSHREPLYETSNDKSIDASMSTHTLQPTNTNDDLADLQYSLKTCSAAIQNTLETLFGKLGRRIGTNPWLTIILSLTFSFSFAFGFLGWQTESRVNKLWIPPDTRAIDESNWINEIFGDQTRTTEILLRPADESPNINVLTPHYIQQFWIAHNLMVNTSTKAPSKHQQTYPGYYSWDGYNHSQSICFRRGLKCQMDTILDIFGYKYKDIINITQQYILDTINNESYIATHLQTELFNILASIQYDNNGTIIGAAILRGVYTITAAAIEENNALIDPSRERWELAIAHKIVNYPFISTQIVPYNEASFNDELASAIAGDLKLLAIGCTLLLLYCCIALGKRDYVSSAIGLGISAMLTIALCMLSAFGLAGAFGIIFTDFTLCLPFLVLGLGVDNCFIIFGEFQAQIKEHPTTRQTEFLMQETMAHAGVSILITSLTDIFAFLIGSTTVLPALNAFCLYAAFAVIFVFILNITFFSAAVCIDHLRIKQHRYDICCCLKADPLSSENERRSYLCILHKIPDEISNKIFKKIAEILTNTVAQCIVLVLFVAMMVVCIYFASFLKQDFNLEWFLPDSSYLQQYYQWRDDYFQSTTAVFIYTKDINYYQHKEQLYDAKDLLSNANYLSGSYIDWHSSFWNYLNATQQIASINEDNYVDMLYNYLYISGDGLQYASFVEFDNKTTPKQIQGAFMLGEYKKGSVDSAENQIHAMQMIRSHVSDIMLSTDMFPFSFQMLFWEQFAVIDKELYRNLGLAIFVVFVITLFLIPKLMTAILVLITVFATIVDILGFMYFWDLSIDGISVCYLVVAIGLSVDYSAHIGEAFMICNKETKQKRVIYALYRTGSSVFNGGFSTFLAVLTMAFSQTYIFRVFFKVFLLVCMFGLIHGLIVLPVLLLLFGPNTTLKQDINTNDATNENTPIISNHMPLISRRVTHAQ